jgi:hypothetical protein
MGLFDKVKDAKAQAAAAMEQAGAAQSGFGGGGAMAGMGGQDMAVMAAYAQKANKIGQTGIEAPGVIHTIRVAGTPDVSGATMHNFDVTIRPANGEPYETTIDQSMLPFQMEGLSEGQAVTVKYDPDYPLGALLHSW